MPSPALPRVAILHPELVVGGAERFTLDAAHALRSLGHEVTLHVARMPRGLTFSDVEASPVPPRVVAPYLPATLLGGLRAPLTVAALCGAGASALRLRPAADVIVVDTASAVIPFLRAMGHRRIVFYGHFPDRRLARHDGWRGVYRRPLDWLEARGLQEADRVLINSNFTRLRYNDEFPALRLDEDTVLHPAILEDVLRTVPALPTNRDAPFEVLALSRFAPEKGHMLALDAFLDLHDLVPAAERRLLRLTLAGALDPRVREQQSMVRRLRQRIAGSSATELIRLEVSIDEQRKRDLMRRCSVVVYPPVDEPFGLVPLEAMASARPVVAIHGGGPTETVVDRVTGRLVPPEAASVTAALNDLRLDRARARAWGLAGRQAVHERFSFARFAQRLHRHVVEVAGSRVHQ